MSEVYYCGKLRRGSWSLMWRVRRLNARIAGTIREIRTDGQKVEEHRLTGYAKREIRAEEKQRSARLCPAGL